MKRLFVGPTSPLRDERVRTIAFAEQSNEYGLAVEIGADAATDVTPHNPNGSDSGATG